MVKFIILNKFIIKKENTEDFKVNIEDRVYRDCNKEIQCRK